jgi:hypothetical protein
VEEDVGHPVIRNDEAESFGDVEPFDSPADLDDLERLLGQLGSWVALQGIDG